MELIRTFPEIVADRTGLVSGRGFGRGFGGAPAF